METGNKKISVIIPCYSAEATIENCLRSIFETGYRPLEVIVVDDGSTDDTVPLLEKLQADTEGRLIVVRATKNGGPAIARNIGAKRATGEYLFFMDADTEAQPDLFDRYLDCMARSGADVVSGLYHFEPLNRGVTQTYKALYLYCAFSKDKESEYNVINSAVAGIKREIYLKEGGYNESIGWGIDIENEEFGKRLFAKYKMVMDSKMLVRHHFPGFTRLTKNYFKRVSMWMEMFLRSRKFETKGPASKESGIATASVSMFMMLAAVGVLEFFKYWAWGAALFFLLLYLRGYGKSLLCAARKKPLFFPFYLLLNLWFCNVLTAGAALGALRVLVGMGRVPKNL